MTKVAFIYLNIANYEPPFESVPQAVSSDVEYSVHHFTDENFPPRSAAITPRLQSKIPKFFGWQMALGYDIYIWADSGFAMHRNDSVMWLLGQLGKHDICFIKHPTRTRVVDEANFIRENLPHSNRLMARYKNELLDEGLTAIDLKKDKDLYAAGIFAYRNIPKVQKALKEWWYYTSRYHLDDQLFLPYVMRNCDVGKIDEDYYHCKYFDFIRKHHG
jgi:hypothetical protein